MIKTKKIKQRLFMYEGCLIVASNSRQLFKKLKIKMGLGDNEYQKFLDEKLVDVKWIKEVDGYRVTIDNDYKRDDFIRDIATISIDNQRRLLKIIEKYDID